MFQKNTKIKYWYQSSTFRTKPGKKVLITHMNFLNRIQKPWRCNWKKYSMRVDKQQKHLREYIVHFCEFHRRGTHLSIQTMKMRLFLTQRNDKFLIVYFLLRMKKRLKQIQKQRRKKLLMGSKWWRWKSFKSYT